MSQEAISSPSSPLELPRTAEEIEQRMSNAYDIAVTLGGVGSPEQWAILAVKLYDTNLSDEAVQRMSNAYKIALAIGLNRSHTQTAILTVKVYDELERLQSEPTEL